MHGRRRFTLWLSFEGGELLDWARAYRCASFLRSICDRCFRRVPAQCAARTRVGSGYSGRRVEHLVQYAKLHSRDRIQVLTPTECNKVTAPTVSLAGAGPVPRLAPCVGHGRRLGYY